MCDATAADAARQLPSELFDGPDSAELAPPLPWYEQAAQQLSATLALIPSDEPGMDRTRADVARVLKRLQLLGKQATRANVDEYVNTNGEPSEADLEDVPV